ncbi:hypothetical protein HOY82DRAFT_479678 [Tuber indicum]|nr:hypothetical protein HOY82DRAFT_479678 [Tuber indicum]
MVSRLTTIPQTEKRDTLMAIENKYQEQWTGNEIIEIDAATLEEDHTTCPEKLRGRHPKSFGCMAYPYMNGSLHAGHSFSLSRVEFATGYQLIKGSPVSPRLPLHGYAN